MERAIRKDIGRLDDTCRRLIAASRMAFVATFSAGASATFRRAAGHLGS